jgi:hypothetical protein
MRDLGRLRGANDVPNCNLELAFPGGLGRGGLDLSGIAPVSFDGCASSDETRHFPVDLFLRWSPTIAAGLLVRGVRRTRSPWRAVSMKTS